MTGTFHQMEVGRPTCRQHKACTSMGARLMRKYRRANIRKLKQKEYKRLKTVLPSIAEQQHVNKLTVIEEAIRYIDLLHNSLKTKIQVTQVEDATTPIKHGALVSATHKLFMMKQRIKAPLTPSNDVNVWRETTSSTARDATLS